jgi:tRNA-dihydrouridine synthase
VDGVLIGRASFGEPWIFSEQVPESQQEKFRIALEHCRKHQELFGTHVKAFAPMKKHLGWYCRGFSGAKELRLQLMACDDSAQVETILNRHGLLPSSVQPVETGV